MQADYITTIFALVLGLTVVAVVWSIIMYFSELGSEEGKREYKALIIGSTTTLIVLFVVWEVIVRVRSVLGF